jgi:23S rRNA (uracil1939-C5)-methyltransferase
MVGLLIGQEFELDIERLGIYGEGVGRLEGFAIFIDGALPGERVVAKIYELHKSFGRAHIKKILISSKNRITPVCPLFGTCGGCQLLHLEYSQQLLTKRQKVVDAFERIGGFFEATIAPCEPSPLQLGYRNKIQLPTSKENPVTLGLYARKTHDLVKVSQCFIHCDLGEEVFTKLAPLLKAHASSESLKHVLIKTSVISREVLVILVTTLRNLPYLSELAKCIIEKIPEVRGVVQNVNPSLGNVILSEDYVTLAGDPFIEEKILGYKVKISPASFFQVNTYQAEKLYKKAIELCALTGAETVLDAYCGVGVLSLLIASHAKRVIGIECVQDAVANAKENAQSNHISNIEFTCAPVEETISSLKNIDVALLNPPRKGCSPLFLEALTAAAPKKIVYISCDPATLARDLKYLCSKGYVLESAHPFDLFPQTGHVECIVSIARTQEEIKPLRDI